MTSGVSSAPWADPLAWMIGAERAAGFLDDVYEREAMIVTHDDPERFRPLLTIAGVDRIVAGLDLREGMLDMAHATRDLSREDYTAPGGAIERAAVARLYGQGATIILNQLHQSDLTLAAFCRGVEQALSCHVQTNVYLTPPDAQGFRTHYDNHDVFVLQIEGEKRWRLYDTPVDTPYRGEGFRPGAHEVGEPRHEFILKAGDCAYVPRGLMHDASTSGDQTSLHVTCGLIVRTWADLVLEAVSEVALQDPAFRRSLPPGYARPDFDRTAAKARFRDLIAAIPAKAGLDNALDLMIDTFIRSREPEVSGAVLHAARGAEGRFRARPSAIWRLAEDGDDLVLVAPAGDGTFAPADEPALRRALSGEPFAAPDLGAADPAAMVSRLLTAGLIERLDG